MTIKGYSDRAKTSASLPDYVTVSPVRQQQFGADVISHTFVQVIGADSADATSTARVIQAPAHAALVGDVISWTSGALSALEHRVQAVTTNTITLAEIAAAAPATNDTFNILRPKFPTVTSTGGLTIPAPTGFDSTKTTVATNLNSSVNIPTGSYIQLIAATTNAINMLFVADTSGQFLILATGAAASEVDRIYLPPGGSTAGYPINIAAGTRIALKAITTAATTGRFILTGM